VFGEDWHPDLTANDIQALKEAELDDQPTESTGLIFIPPFFFSSFLSLFLLVVLTPRPRACSVPMRTPLLGLCLGGQEGRALATATRRDC
jgi:hypothetical protein